MPLAHAAEPEHNAPGLTKSRVYIKARASGLFASRFWQRWNAAEEVAHGAEDLLHAF